MKKSNHNIPSPTTHYLVIPHTIILPLLVSKNLLFVVLLQYMTLHTLHSNAQQKNSACLRNFYTKNIDVLVRIIINL